MPTWQVARQAQSDHMAACPAVWATQATIQQGPDAQTAHRTTNQPPDTAG